MAFQAVPNCAKVAVVTGYLTSVMVNVFHFVRPGSWGIPELQDLVVGVGTSWVNDVMPLLSANAAFRRVEGRGLRAIDDVAYEYVAPQPVSGGQPGDSLPGSVAFAITHLTGLAGRSTRGRTFFGGFAESAVSGDFLAQSIADGLRDSLNGLRLYADSLDWTMVVVSRFSNRTRRPEGVTIPVIGFRWRDRVVDSQRRRLTGRGQ